MFAISAPGLERILASELDPMGARDAAVIEGGVEFSGDLAFLYNANLSLRTASRVVVRVAEFHADSFHELERRAKKVRWDEYLSRGSRVRFRVTCRKSRLYHSDAVAERFAEAIVNRVGEVDVVPTTAESAESSEEADQSIAAGLPSQLFIVRLTHDNCVVSVDSSGALLHRRGYRQASGKAPLRETLAAAMVLGSGWDRRSPLVDPMCGSGTVAIEAALIARGILPGMHRSFAFESWPGYDSHVWTSIKAKAGQMMLLRSNGAILASDRDDGVVKSACENAARAGVLQDINFDSQPISAIKPPSDAGSIVTNPPYGIRVGERRPLRNLYARLGKILKEKANGYTLALLSADRPLESMLGVPLEEVFRTRNGGIPVRLMKGRIE
jgi:putative N6-adenine-specific DNA methylase